MVANRKDHTSYRKPMTLRAAAWVCCLGLLLCISPARAGITWTGDVTPGDPTNWTSSTDGRIGDTGVGTIDVTSGSSLLNDDAYVGYAAGATGTVTIDGAGSTWTQDDDLFVALSGDGTLNVINGGAVTTTDVAGVGRNEGSLGTATVDGVGSGWTARGNRDIGLRGTGTLDITNGGSASNVEAPSAGRVPAPARSPSMAPDRRGPTQTSSTSAVPARAS